MKTKEEQKQHLIDMMKDDEELGLYEEPKQETTLEENLNDPQWFWDENGKPNYNFKLKYKMEEEIKQETTESEELYKQDIIQLIEDRILSEYKKHSASLPDEWAKIAAYKIHKSISDKMEEPKQETIEEAAEKYADFSNDYIPMSFGGKFNETTKKDFIAGAKWQAERMYSEEEVKTICDKYHNQMCLYGNKKAQEWFEQLKKK